MDNLQPPDALKELWLGGEERKENIDMIVASALVDARKYRQGAQKLDAVVILILALAALVLLASYGDGLMTYLAQAAYAGYCVIGLYAYRRFYRMSREEPVPGAPATEYAASYVQYLEKRADFLRWGLRPFWLVPLSGILGAIAGIQNDEELLGFGWCGLCLLLVPLAWWMTRYETRKIAARIARLRPAVEDQSEV